MITARELSFTYVKSAAPAVRNLSFSIEAGEIFGFLGPSGAGKSTTQKVLIGLLKGYEGRVSVMGRELRDWRSDYFEQVGVGFELPNHYGKLTGLENLEYFRSLYSGDSEDSKRLLDRVGLSAAAKQPVARYSKGMQMRLAFARALLNKPRLLFLDEPTSGLDPVNARLIKEIVREKRATGTTVFLTTHNMTVADELCDRVAFIVDGQIKVIDAPKALKESHGQRKVAVEYGQSRCEFPLDGLGDNAAFLELLRREDLRSIHTQEATLEQVFITVTGQGLA